MAQLKKRVAIANRTQYKYATYALSEGVAAIACDCMPKPHKYKKMIKISTSKARDLWVVGSSVHHRDLVNHKYDDHPPSIVDPST